jgi:hypothetical protein
MVIISRKSGRLGNRLFSFAHYIANSLEYGPYTVLSPVFDEYSVFFVGSDNRWLTGFSGRAQAAGSSFPAIRRIGRKIFDYLIYAVTNPLRRDRIAFLHSPVHEVIDLHHPAEYEWRQTGFLKFVRRKIVVSNGWVFWDHQSFIKHAAKIREYFRLVPPLEERVQRYIGQCRNQGTVLVGVHIRHGDYRTAGGGGFFYETCHYAALMRQLAQTIEQPVRFLVCSDEPVSPADFAGLDICCGPGTPIEDMYSLAACDYILGPPSSFSGWASFYGQVPLYFICNLPKALAGISMTEFIPLNSLNFREATSRYEGNCP